MLHWFSVGMKHWVLQSRLAALYQMSQMGNGIHIPYSIYIQVFFHCVHMIPVDSDFLKQWCYCVTVTICGSYLTHHKSEFIGFHKKQGNLGFVSMNFCTICYYKLLLVRQVYIKSCYKITASKATMYLWLDSYLFACTYYLRCKLYGALLSPLRNGADQQWKRWSFIDNLCHMDQPGIPSENLVCMGSQIQRSSFWIDS